WWGTWCHPYTLFLWSTLAKLRGIKFAIVSVGAGPIDAKLSRIFIKYALSLADYRSYRDEDSKKYIARVVGFKKEASVFPDLAHSLSIEKYQRDCNRTGQQKLLVVGISPMCYFDPRYWMERDRSVYLGYLTKLAEFVAWLIEQEYQIVYFTSCTQEDPPALEDLKAILAQQGITYSPGQIVEQPINTVDELMTEIVKTDIAIASRFHGVLLSLVLHKPTLAISYYRKIDMLMNDTEQAEYCVSIDTFAVEELKQKFISLAANREKIATQLAKHSQNYRATLNKQYESLFNN
ncbi:MAG: polysaccharide pyruvyl transferase family protein, partial [Xenococcaceae cyanobacterium]